jgi:hypothetical protein
MPAPDMAGKLRAMKRPFFGVAYVTTAAAYMGAFGDKHVAVRRNRLTRMKAFRKTTPIAAATRVRAPAAPCRNQKIQLSPPATCVSSHS